MKPQQPRENDPAITAIRSTRGMAGKIAARLDLSREAVRMWKSVPANHVLVVAEMLGMSPQMVRPDIYPAQTPTTLVLRVEIHFDRMTIKEAHVIEAALTKLGYNVIETSIVPYHPATNSPSPAKIGS
jgi:hypothetical protein